MQTIIGWDIGGAHLKAARVENGRVTVTASIACPLWQGLAQLDRAFMLARALVGEADTHAVTMTGELCDAFASREAGVIGLAARAAAEFPVARLQLYAGRAGFVPLDSASTHTGDIASANWHATAALTALHHADAIMIDMGSTTTDLIPIIAGDVAPRGYGDATRAENGELVYTGLVRSFVMALADRAPFAGKWSVLMNEYFASSADIHRILGQLPEGADVMASADGRDKTLAASTARLARMIGRDAADAPQAAWQNLAAWFAEAQMRSLADAAHQVISRHDVTLDAPVICAGIGRGVVRRLAARLGRAAVDFGTLVDVAPAARNGASDCAPAVAVALLLAHCSRAG